jgi:hypothetical protein
MIRKGLLATTYRLSLAAFNDRIGQLASQDMSDFVNPVWPTSMR